MRILHCIPTLGMGGAERQMALLGAAQARSGHIVHVALVRGGANRPLLEGAGVAMHILPVRGNSDPALLTGLLRTVLSVRPDLVQTWLLQMDVAGGIAALLTRTPWLLAERSSEDAYARGLKQRLRTMLGRMASGIVANSDCGEAYWRVVAPRVPRWVIRNAVRLEQIRTTPPAEAPPHLMLFVGRLNAGKRVDALLRALARVKGSALGPLLVCGDGPDRVALEGLATRLGLKERVRFLGIRADVWPLMRAAALVVNPSAFEGCPNVVLEAMASGRPLVVSDIPAHRELLDERAAWLVDFEDTDAAATAIEEALLDRVEAMRRSEEAARRVEAFRIPRLVEQYDSVYRQVLAARGRRERG